ncbi:MAG: hypothetical protein PHS77_03550 [Gallionellaceae bacterium]|nr:hypothetical protein [Gallionellaceae bacterium]
MKTLPALLAIAFLAGCAGLAPPPAERLAALPVVAYPDQPPAGDYVYKLPAGQPIEMRLRADGSALDGAVEQTVGARLARDLYLHKRWASEDGRTWVAADQLIGVNLAVTLPSYTNPGPADIHLTVERKAGN